jgi:excinuclease UvrABC nuclease subunit
MPTDDSELQTQAHTIIDAIAFIPFEQCQPLNRGFENIPARPGIYAIRHRTDGLLYIGKTKSLRGRFSGGHKAFLWAWLDKYNDEDVRIAVQIISHWEKPALLLQLEAIILRATEPPYNVQIPTEM